MQILQPGSQSGIDFQADLARILRSKADLPQGRFPLTPSPVSLSKTVPFLPYTQETGLPALQVRKPYGCQMKLGSDSFQILAAEIGLKLERSLLCLFVFLEFLVGRKSWKFAGFFTWDWNHISNPYRQENKLANLPNLSFKPQQWKSYGLLHWGSNEKERWRKKKILAHDCFPRERDRLASCQSERCWFGLYFSTPWCILCVFIESECPCA